MSQNTASSDAERPRGGRGRGKSRGGLGKYLRARGRGRGLGRPAEFGKRLVLEGEETVEGEDAEAEAAEISEKYSRRRLGTNADRYVEPEPELDSDGEEKLDPEVDLSSFLARQRLSEASSSSLLTPAKVEDDEEVDHTIAPVLSTLGHGVQPSRKGQVQQIEWDEQLEEMSREKATADAARDLKTRFRANSEWIGGKARMSTGRGRREKPEKNYVEAPPLIVDHTQHKTPKNDMQDFLDDLLG